MKSFPHAAGPSFRQPWGPPGGSLHAPWVIPEPWGIFGDSTGTSWVSLAPSVVGWCCLVRAGMRSCCHIGVEHSRNHNVLGNTDRALLIPIDASLGDLCALLGVPGAPGVPWSVAGVSLEGPWRFPGASLGVPGRFLAGLEAMGFLGALGGPWVLEALLCGHDGGPICLQRLRLLLSCTSV